MQWQNLLLYQKTTELKAVELDKWISSTSHARTITQMKYYLTFHLSYIPWTIAIDPAEGTPGGEIRIVDEKS